jgi:DUF1365 family protein
METDPNVGPLTLSCADNETAIKFTVYDNDNRVYDATTACVRVDASDTAVLTMLDAAYSPNDW